MATDEATREFSASAKELGDQIVKLTLLEAKELSDYLEEVHGIKAAAGGAVMMAPTVATVAVRLGRRKRPSSTSSWKASATRRSASSRSSAP